MHFDKRSDIHAVTLHGVGERLQDLDVLLWPVVIVRFHHTEPFDDRHAAADTTKYGVLAIQPLSWGKCNEELAAIAVWTTVRHR